MRKTVAVLFLLFCAASLHAKDKPNPADYTIKVHISASHIDPPTIGRAANYADATLDGKKLQLSGDAVNIGGRVDRFALIIPGDYMARLKKDFHNADSTAIHQEYDVLLSDGTVWHCMISGISE